MFAPDAADISFIVLAICKELVTWSGKPDTFAFHMCTFAFQIWQDCINIYTVNL